VRLREDHSGSDCRGPFDRACTEIPVRLPMGTAPKLMSPDEFAAFTRYEKERWGRIIQRANIKVE